MLLGGSPDSTQPTVSETLNKAADLIEERGWSKGVGWPGAEQGVSTLCLEGGIMAALGMDDFLGDYNEFRRCPAFRAVQAYLGGDHVCAFLWNDEKDRTAEQVISVLRATALIEAAKETDTRTVYARAESSLADLRARVSPEAARALDAIPLAPLDPDVLALVAECEVMGSEVGGL